MSNGKTRYIQECSYNCTAQSTTVATILNVTNSCCNTSNCNAISLPQVVSSCYSFGNYSTSPTSTATIIPYGEAQCVSPKNQYCIHSRGYDMIYNKYISLFSCSDSCPDSTSDLFTICCNNNDNCNSPSRENKSFK
jgi:hypothetical protein